MVIKTKKKRKKLRAKRKEKRKKEKKKTVTRNGWVSFSKKKRKSRGLFFLHFKDLFCTPNYFPKSKIPSDQFDHQQ